jgi:hypothetical protein
MNNLPLVYPIADLREFSPPRSSMSASTIIGGKPFALEEGHLRASIPMAWFKPK